MSNLYNVHLTTNNRDREGWAYIDDIPDDQICDPLVSTHLPIGLHYCKRYFLGKVHTRSS